jgi:hypothetical protein
MKMLKETKMSRVRFVQIGKLNSKFLHNIVYALTHLQDGFLFDIDQQPFMIDVNPAEGEYNEDIIDDQVLPSARKKYPGEYIVAVCDLPLRNQLSTSFNADGALVSVNKWESDYGTFSIDKVFAYHLIDILLTRRIMMPGHSDVRRCPSDECDEREDRLLGISNCKFCNDCDNYINSSIQKGEIPQSEAAAIYRILDWISNVRRVFVAMPFGGVYDIYFSTIKPVLEKCKCNCIRADELYKPREIIDLVWQEIRRASLVIADITDGNPNVMYEVGYAHALASPTILLCQDKDKVPFDLRHQRLITYSTDSNGCKKLMRDLIGYL